MKHIAAQPPVIPKPDADTTVAVRAKGFVILQIVLIPVIAALDYTTSVIIQILKIPMYMDTWATMFGVIVGGLWVGAAGGFLYNLIMAFTLWGLPAWVWGLINLYIAGITWVFWRIGWISIKRPAKLIVAAIVIAVTDSIPILLVTIVFFGLLPPSGSYAFIYAAIFAVTKDPLSATYGMIAISDMPDKFISVLLAATVASRMPARFSLQQPKIKAS